MVKFHNQLVSLNTVMNFHELYFDTISTDLVLPEKTNQTKTIIVYLTFSKTFFLSRSDMDRMELLFQCKNFDQIKSQYYGIKSKRNEYVGFRKKNTSRFQLKYPL